MKKALTGFLVLMLMLVSASAPAAAGDAAQITDTLRRAGITQPVANVKHFFT